MSTGDKIGVGVGAILLLSIAFFVGMSYQSHHCIGFLTDGRKFVSVKDGCYEYIISDRWINIEKLPNGFYRQK